MTLSSTATFFHALYLYFSYAHQGRISREKLENEQPWTGGEGGNCSNLKREAAGLSGLGEVFARALLVVCVQLDIRNNQISMWHSHCIMEAVGRKGRRESRLVTSKSSSLLGFALSLRESSTAFLKASVWATMV